MRLKIIRADDSIKHIALVGRLDLEGATSIQYEFLQETTTVPTFTVVDISKVSFVASLGIGMLLAAAKQLERRGVKLVLLAPSTLVCKALESSGIHEVIPIVDDEPAALALFR